MRRSAVILLACALVVGALLIAFVGGSGTPIPTDPMTLQESDAPWTTLEISPAADSEDAVPVPESRTGPTNAALDIRSNLELVDRPELTNAEALEMRDEQFGWARGSSDPYTYAPTIKVTPAFPPEAIPLGMSGFVLMEYTVAADGAIGPIAVLNASSPLFELAAIRSVERYKYAPRIERGQFVDTNGVQTLIVYGEPDFIPTVPDSTERVIVSMPGAD